MKYQQFEFIFEGRNKRTGKVKEFRSLAFSRLAALQKLEQKYPGWDFIY